jgi:hypothetical protein
MTRIIENPQNVFKSGTRSNRRDGRNSGVARLYHTQQQMKLTNCTKVQKGETELEPFLALSPVPVPDPVPIPAPVPAPFTPLRLTKFSLLTTPIYCILEG